jgi:hypothetical protein
MAVKVFKAKVAVGSQILDCDAIEHQGKLWLVPFWLDSPSQGVTTPGRIIRFDCLSYSDTRGSNIGDFVIHKPIPKALFEHQTPKEPVVGYEYILCRRANDRWHDD